MHFHELQLKSIFFALFCSFHQTIELDLVAIERFSTIVCFLTFSQESFQSNSKFNEQNSVISR